MRGLPPFRLHLPEGYDPEAPVGSPLLWLYDNRKPEPPPLPVSLTVWLDDDDRVLPWPAVLRLPRRTP